MGERSAAILLAADTYRRAFTLWSAGQLDETITLTIQNESLLHFLVIAEEQYTALALGIWNLPAMTLTELFDHVFLPHRAALIRAAVAHLEEAP